MNANVYRFEIDPRISLAEVEMSLLVAQFAVEGIFGSTRSRLEFNYFVDELHRAIYVDGTTEVGLAVTRAFTNLILIEFGEDVFAVRRVGPPSSSRTDEYAA